MRKLLVGPYHTCTKSFAPVNTNFQIKEFSTCSLEIPTNKAVHTYVYTSLYSVCFLDSHCVSTHSHVTCVTSVLCAYVRRISQTRSQKSGKSGSPLAQTNWRLSS